MQKSLFDLKEVALATGLSIYTIRAWAHTGKIPTVKLGRRRMVRKNDLERMVNSGVNDTSRKPKSEEPHNGNHGNTLSEQCS